MMGKSPDERLAEEELLEILQWHIGRADVQRSGMWTRAAASLSGNALIVAGAALVGSLLTAEKSEVSAAARATATTVIILALLSSMASIFAATRAFGGVVRWRGALRESDPRLGILYSLIGTVNLLPTFPKFMTAVTERSIKNEVEGAMLELWRLSFLQRRRMRALNLSVWLFALSVALVIAGLSIAMKSS